MSVILDADVIRLQGDCRVEDAELLLTLLHADPHRTVDLTKVGHLHTAVLQILFAFEPQWIGPVENHFVQRWLTPLLIVNSKHDEDQGT